MASNRPMIGQLQKTVSNDGRTTHVSTRYVRLSPARSQIRICHILPALSDGRIACELRPASMNNLPRYNCLSYVWGEHKDKAEILLNGESFEVTSNLHIILQHLQCNCYGEPIWIDAMCVNQADEEEKTHQVAMMGRIYQQAKEVLVWLGPVKVAYEGGLVTGADHQQNQAHDAGEAVAMLRDMASGLHFHELPYFQRCASEECFGRLDLPRKSWTRAAKSLLVMLKVPWFTRTWVVQEIVLARRATMIHGKYSLPWEIIVAAWTNWNRHAQSCCGDCVSSLNVFDYALINGLVSETLEIEHARQQLRLRITLCACYKASVLERHRITETRYTVCLEYSRRILRCVSRQYTPLP